MGLHKDLLLVALKKKIINSTVEGVNSINLA